MRVIHLIEYQTSERIALSVTERDALRDAVRSLTIVPSRERTGVYDVTAGSEIGAVRVGDLCVEIRPKVPVERVFFMMSYALGKGRFALPKVLLEERASIFEALVPVFNLHLRQALGRGVLHGYRVDEDTLTTVRGRIDLSVQLRTRYGAAVPVSVCFDEYTDDILENRILKAAIRHLGRLPMRNGRDRLVLRGYGAMLNSVADKTFESARVPEVAYTRLNEHYRPALQLATLILRNASLEVRHGVVAGTAILFDMNRVVEEFVVVALREALSLSERRFLQGCSGKPLYLDEGFQIKLKPDISWWDDSCCRFVGDVKYKEMAPEGRQHDDLYQLLAYCTATGLPRGTLVYAATTGGRYRHMVRLAEKSLEVYPLNLNAPPEALLQQVRDLATVVRNEVEGAG